MLSQYISGAMHKAKYEILQDDGMFYGEIPGFEGVHAHEPTLEGTRDDLEEALELWLLYRISHNLPVPEVDGIKLDFREAV